MITPLWLGDAEMQRLPPDVQEEYQQGHTVFYFAVLPRAVCVVSGGLQDFLARPTCMLFLRQLRKLTMSIDGRSQCLEKALQPELDGDGMESIKVAGGGLWGY